MSDSVAHESDTGVETHGTILAVDDDPGILSALVRLLRVDGIRVLTATNGPDAILMLEEHAASIGVLISDYAMPGMTGAELLRTVRLRWPDIIRVLLTGNADLPAAARAVNDGRLSRLYTKPWQPEEFRRAVAEALEQHRMVIESQRQIVDQSAELQRANASLGRDMLQLVRLLQTFLGWRFPERASECKDVARWAGKLADLAELAPEDARRIQVAALIHDIGLMRLPDRLLQRARADQTLAGRIQYQQHPVVGSLLLSAAEPLADMAKWIRSHHERWDGKGYPDGLVGDAIPMGARIIALADGYRQALSGEGGTAPRWRSLQESTGTYDPRLMGLLNDEIQSRPPPPRPGERSVSLAGLREGMVLAEPIRSITGAVLIAAGETLNADQVNHALQLLDAGKLVGVKISITDPDAAAGASRTSD